MPLLCADIEPPVEPDAAASPGVKKPRRAADKLTVTVLAKGGHGRNGSQHCVRHHAAATLHGVVFLKFSIRAVNTPTG